MFKLQELQLDGNPICEMYNHESYVNELRKFLTHLKILVGIL